MGSAVASRRGWGNRPRRSLLSRMDRRRGRTGCWLWLGAKDDKGYGVARVNGRLIRVHRFMLGLLLGRPVHADCDAHHDPKKGCSTNPACCNPTHLREVRAPIHRQWNLWRGVRWRKA